MTCTQLTIAVQQGATPEYTTPAEFAAYIAEEISKWTADIKQAGIQAN